MESLTKTKQPEVKNFIGGEFVRSVQPSMEVESPLTVEIISTLPMSSKKDLDDAVESVKDAFSSWSALTLKERGYNLVKCYPLIPTIFLL